MGNQPSFSVIVPTLNAASHIQVLIASLLRQTYQPNEILVIDSTSDDDTVLLTEGFSQENVRIVTIPRSEFSHGGTRHLGVTLTQSEFICFLTQDSLPAQMDYFEKLLHPFVDSTVALVTGRQTPRADSRLFEQRLRAHTYPPKSFKRTREDVKRLGTMAYFASDVCSAYRRTAYDLCGGFELTVNTNEDMLIAARFLHSGYSVYYSSEAQVIHSHNLSLKEQFARNVEIGRFLERYQDELTHSSELSTGASLFKEILRELFCNQEYLEIPAFLADSCARLLGNRVGRITQRREMSKI